jgi:hypothetical protein
LFKELHGMIDSRKVLLQLIPTALLILISPGSAASENDTSMIPGSCTIFAISQGESAFFGNNEDWKDPLTYVWVEPPDAGKYGVLCFGFENLYPQGGINEKGLAFDANALPIVPVKKNPDGLKPYQAIVNNIIMRECATVEEAIETAKSYDWSQQYGGRIDGQFMLADATGDAVVISADSTGEIVFTRKPKGDGFLVSTNHGEGLPLGLEASDDRPGVHPQLDDLERHAATDGVHLFGQVHNPHAAFTELLEDLVRADAAGWECF